MADVPEFQNALLRFVKASYSEVLTSIRDTKKLEPDTEELLKKAITECVSDFGATHSLVTEEA